VKRMAWAAIAFSIPRILNDEFLALLGTFMSLQLVQRLLPGTLLRYVVRLSQGEFLTGLASCAKCALARRRVNEDICSVMKCVV
jgi:hypothetical protein